MQDRKISKSGLMSLDEALSGLQMPDGTRNMLALVNLPYLSFEGIIRTGQMVVNKRLVIEIKEIFTELLRLRFPIYQMVPVSAFGWDDDASMEANNSSAFNYRPIAGTDRLSEHSFGWALDLNPVQNPFFARSGNIYPAGATYDLSVPGTIGADSEVAAIFKGKGWEWGGDWKTPIDYQHFEKPFRK
ncbi:MAG: peptidoglycan LD-endopeptidase CwlK [Candidatus Parcubacteria bacterium]|jgi:hypothetical protein|nr:peptidoglycan LD-endopeptidase CwlK [Candidatus Parcubacteria bacterium]